MWLQLEHATEPASLRYTNTDDADTKMNRLMAICGLDVAGGGLYIAAGRGTIVNESVLEANPSYTSSRAAVGTQPAIHQVRAHPRMNL